MENEFAFLCDYAAGTPDQKIQAIGIGWDTVYAQSLPWPVPMMCFVARLTGTAAENGNKDVSIRILGADGGNLIPPIDQSLPFQVRAPALVGHTNVIIQLGGLTFTQYGLHGIHLVVQGHDMAHLTFTVSPPPTTG